MLEAQRERKRQVEQEYGCTVEALFFYYEPSRNGLPAGRRIKSFRRAWATATDAAGVPGLLFHDLRRSSARNLILAGVAERIAMKLTGHLTPSVFRRYGIVDRAMLEEGVGKLADWRNGTVNGKESAKSEGEEGPSANDVPAATPDDTVT